jgi:PIN domain nuclease of toxin-antitoxin system
VNLLLDTHALLWWLDDRPTLSTAARAAIADTGNLILISAAVIWEIKIKQRLGKLKIPRNFRKVLDVQPFEMLSITVEHAYAVGELPVHHRDPFDRILIAQAKVEGLTVVTRDNCFGKYRISTIDA